MSTQDAEAPGPVRPKRSIWLHVPPPLLFVATFLAGAQLDWLVASSALPERLRSASQVVGVAILVAAGALVAAAPLLFLLRRTTILPHAKSTALITSGPYRVSRNPMYLSLATGYVGLAFLLDVLWPLLLLPLPLWVISTRVIPVEEHALTEVFGDEYRAYQRRVRRWL